MQKKYIVFIVALLMVLGWSVAMTAMGQTAAIATLAPALGLTVQQIVQAARSRTAASGHRVASVPDGEDTAP
jgi:small-conductance mechanosensitive channel